MSDFQVKVGGDFSEVLRGFGQLEARAQQAGQGIGQGLNRPIQEVSSKSLAALNAELNKLQARQNRVSVDSSDFVQTGLRIRDVQSKIAEVERRKILIGADPSSIIALQTRLGGLREELDRTKIGSQRFKELQAEVRKTEIELNKATGAGGGFGERMRQLGPALAAVGLAGVGVTRALGSVISTAAQFDQEVRKAAAIEGSGQFNALRGAIEGVASAAAGTPTQVAQLATALSRAGFSAAETEAALGGIVTGAEATAVSFEDMGSIVSNVLRSFGLDASKTNDVVDTLTNTANSSNQSVLDLGEAFKVAAPVARNLGVGVDDLSATLALLANNGIRGSEAGTALRTGLTRLQIAAGGSNEELLGLTRGSQLLANAMKKLGADVLDTNGNLKPMDEVILSLRENINQFDTTKRAEITKALFGDEQASKFLALLNSSEEDIRSLFGEIRNSGGVAEETRRQMQGFSFSFEQLKGNVENVTNAIGGAFLAVLKPMVDGLNLTLSAAQALPTPIRNLAAALAAAGIAAGGAAVTIGLFKTALAGVSVAGTIAAISGLVTALKVNLAGAATVAIVSMQGLAGALKTLFTANLVQAIGPLVTALKVQLAGAASVAASAFAALGAAIKSGALIASLKAFALAATGAVVALAPVALAIGGVIALVKTWEFVLSGAGKASEEFAKSQDAVSVALAKIGADLDETAKKAKEANAGFLGLGEVFRNAREGWTLMRLVDETKKLEAGFDQVFNSAIKFTNELKNSSEVTDEQRKKAQEYIKQLQAISEAYRAQAERAKTLAVEEARLGNQDVAKYYESQSRSLVSNANALDNLRQGFERQIGVQSAATTTTEDNTDATNANKEAQDRIAAAIKSRAEAEAELNQIIAEAPVRNLDAQLAVGKELLSLSQAIAAQEQSRFAVVKAGLEFELKSAQERGASESQLGAIKKQIQEVDRQALQARFQGLQQEQALQVKMLELSQQKARLEADLSVQQQRAEILKAQAELQKLGADASAEERAAAQANVNLQQAILGIRTQQRDTLKQTQPIEQQILSLQQQTAINGERAKAAQMGYRIEADGSLVAVNTLAGAADRVGVVTAKSATEQARLTSVAERTGLAIERAADGSFVLGRSQEAVTRATESLNRQLDGSAAAAGKTADAAGGMQGLIKGAVDPATGIAEAFDETGGLIGKINVQQGRDFAAWLSGAKTFAEQITKLPLVNQMGEVANRTQSAANAARVFYDWLERASRLPGSRWTGGPVDAGEQYRVNELGQEALLAGGRLSLINAAPNSLWRAPANGTVIPAGITSRLQEQGALPGRAGAAMPLAGGGSNAALAIEVGKLRQEVGELARKQWNVNIQTRTGPTGSQVLKQMLR
jgi:TP901 family phage tail tape measure protein